MQTESKRPKSERTGVFIHDKALFLYESEVLVCLMSGVEVRTCTVLACAELPTIADSFRPHKITMKFNIQYRVYSVGGNSLYRFSVPVRV